MRLSGRAAPRAGHRRPPRASGPPPPVRADRAAEVGGAPTVADGEDSDMGTRGSVCSPPTTSSSPAGCLDPKVDFERYREATCERFVAMARALGYHAFHDLDELAKDFYVEFWTEWLERPRRDLSGPAVPYIARAMMNKLRDLSRRGRSVRAPQIVTSESEAMLATIAAEDLEPDEQVVLWEQMWLAGDIIRSLPQREQVVFAAVFGRDSRKKGEPPGGYRLAASRLGIREVRAKKLSLSANKRIREAVEKIESGSWCDHWAASIEAVAAGEAGDPDFVRHAQHCVQCRLGVVYLRRHAALLPLPAVVLGEHTGMLPRAWEHVRDGARALRDHVLGLFGRHAAAANDASGLVTSSGGAAGAGITAIKIGAVCVGMGLTGSACLQAVGVPSPILAAVSSSRHSSKPRRSHHQVVRARRTQTTSSTPVTPLPSVSSTTTAAALTKPKQPAHVAKATSASPATRTASAVQTEFNPGGGSGTQRATSTASGSTVSSDRASAETASHAASAPTSSPSPAKSTAPNSSSSHSHHVVTGSSNGLTAP
jgi:hypothetical protein